MSFKKLACSLWACWAILSLSHGYAQDITTGLLNRYTFTNGSLADSQSNYNLSQAPNTAVTPSFDRCSAGNSAVKMHPKGYIAGANYANIAITKRFSYCAWVRPTEVRSGVVFSSGVFPYPDQWVTIGVSPNLTQANFNVLVRQDDYNNPRAEANTPFFPLTPGDEWLFVCLVQDAGRFYFYVNGKKVCDVASPRPRFTAFNPWGQYQLCFGGANGASADSQLGFPGSMDDIRVYNRALTDCEIGTLYRQTPATQTQVLAPLSITRSMANCPTFTYRVANGLATCYGKANDAYLEWTLPNGTKVIGNELNINTVDLAGQMLSVVEKFPATSGMTCAPRTANINIVPVMPVSISPTNIVQTSGSPMSVALTAPNFAGTGAITWKATPQSKNGFTIGESGIISSPASQPGVTTFSVVAVQNGIETCPQTITIDIPCPTRVRIMASDFSKICNDNTAQMVSITNLPAGTPVTWSAYFTDANGYQDGSSAAVIVEGNNASANITLGQAVKGSGTLTLTAVTNGCVYTKTVAVNYILPWFDVNLTACAYQPQNLQGYLSVPSTIVELEFVNELGSGLTITGYVAGGASGSGAYTERFYSITAQANGEGYLPFRMKGKDACGAVVTTGQMFLFANNCGGGIFGRAGKAEAGETSLQIAPNPVAQQITLSGNLENEYAMQLLDAQGKELAQFAGKLKSIEGALQTQVGKLKAGVYFLRTQTLDGTTEVKKFVKVD